MLMLEQNVNRALVLQHNTEKRNILFYDTLLCVKEFKHLYETFKICTKV